MRAVRVPLDELGTYVTVLGPHDGARVVLEQAELAVVARVSTLRDTAAMYRARGAEATYGDGARAQSCDRTADELIGVLADLLTLREAIR